MSHPSNKELLEEGLKDDLDAVPVPEMQESSADEGGETREQRAEVPVHDAERTENIGQAVDASAPLPATPARASHDVSSPLRPSDPRQRRPRRRQKEKVNARAISRVHRGD